MKGVALCKIHYEVQKDYSFQLDLSQIGPRTLSYTLFPIYAPLLFNNPKLPTLN
jgi:hypothetical protein